MQERIFHLAEEAGWGHRQLLKRYREVQFRHLVLLGRHRLGRGFALVSLLHSYYNYLLKAHRCSSHVADKARMA